MKWYWQGAALVVGLAVASRLMDWVSVAWWRQSTPTGWLNLRPPKKTMALALVGGTLWAGGPEGLWIVDRGAGEARQEGDFSDVRALLVIEPDLWVAHSKGLSAGSPGKWRAVSPAGPALALARDRGRVYVGHEHGVDVIDSGTSKRLKEGATDMLFIDSTGRLWAGSGDPVRGGLSYLDRGEWRTVTGLPHQSVTSMLEQPDGVLLIGTGWARHGGLCFWRDRPIATWMKADGLAGERVRSLFRDHAGRYWVGSEYDGVAVFQAGQRSVILSAAQGLSGSEVMAMVEDGEHLWLGTENGLSRIPFDAVPLPAHAEARPLLETKR